MQEVLIAFVSGAVFEGVAVVWATSSTQGKAARAAACSMLQAAALVMGVGEVHGALARVAFVVGFGVGSFLGVVATRH